MATRRAEGGKHLADNASPAGKVVYCSVTMIVTRAMKITLKKVKEDLNVIRVIVFLLYIDGILFLMSSAILYFVWGLALKGRCEAAIQLCLVFYLSGKVLMYLFLVERSHVVRRSGFRRQSDVWYYFNMAQVLLGFGTIAILSFFRPVAQIDPWDEVCKIGLPFRITLPLLIFDIWINVFLTVQFIFFARRFMSNWVPRTLRDAWGKAIHPRLRNDGPAPLEDNPADQRGILADMAWRTCKAMFIVLSTTIANLSVLFALRGHEQGWLCFLMCSVDVVGAIVTIHWLTNEEGQRNEPSNAPNNRDSVVTTYTHPATPENELHRFHSGAYSQTSSRHAYEQK
ncbi:hypothetical protein FGG08_005452 [Glutinoglossum americanum]|uniref:Transmembrane protein n=1 Tax=Glutinoglossum americanum TaxID=1670608 RepID=A0A9P8HYF0_9PEZI|nr:hypothetical protein FGG08_005452 [Glutinoglossum americanum]